MTTLTTESQAIGRALYATANTTGAGGASSAGGDEVLDADIVDDDQARQRGAG